MSRNRKTVEVAPAVYREIESLVEAGHWLSFQEFAREALKEKLERWKAAGHKLPVGPGPEAFVEEVRREPGRRRSP